MRITPLTFNLDRTKFTSKNDDDLRKMIMDSLSDKLSGSSFHSGDEFVPAAPTQPIIIEKLEIKTGESKNNTATTLAGGGLGGAGSVGLSKIGEKKQTAQTQQSPEPQQVDYNKISDEASKETYNEDSQIANSEPDEDLHDGQIVDDDSDFDDECE